MIDSMDCKRVYSADGIKLKARHITAIPQGTLTVGQILSPLSLLHYKIHNVRLCCLRNDKMIVLVSSNTGTQRKITCAVITKYYALGVRNEMRTVRT